jgi:hypothetical protein
MNIKTGTLVIFIFLIGSCGRPDGTLESIGGGYKLYYRHKAVDLLNQQNVFLVGDIRGLSKNDSFILVYRKIDFSGVSDETKDRKWIENNPNDTIQYWIIKLKIDSVYGPLTQNEYKMERYKLKISSSLYLQFDRDSVVRDGF